ncbi:MAG: YkgJ family cysteine cluster protein [Sedimentisphaerales bacterium]|nr:YkgJ family cysteine cluster protein [Sedimentisphaerales bacterium]
MSAENVVAEDSTIIGLDLDIFGTQLEFSLAAGGDARLADIVPAARVICGKITETVLEHIHLSGSCVPCRKECAACCNYLVPLSAPEIFRFRQEIFPRAKYVPDTMLRTYLLAARRLISHRPPQDAFRNPDDLSALSHWYASLNLTCPFLYSRQCSIYHQRPLACREHFVTGFARGCRGNSSKAQAIELPVQMGNILCRLTKELCDVDDTVMMPLALAWYEENKHLDERTWPAATIAKLFVEIAEETVLALGIRGQKNKS